MKKKLFFIIGLMFCCGLSIPSFAAVPTQQEAGGQERASQLQEQEEKLRQKIETEKPSVEIKEELPQVVPAPIPPSQKTLIKNITVTEATIISPQKIKSIIAPFENKELAVKDMQKIADLITDEYRKIGYITSRAYLPPQKVENNSLEIRVIEGRMGDVEVKGNRYFKKSIFTKLISLKKGNLFNYNRLRRMISKINEHPDRKAKAVLAPGKVPGETDLHLEVKDRLPIHAGFTYDNFGSRYVDKDRFLLTLSHNNLLGMDDILTAQYQVAQRENYMLTGLRYLLPISSSTRLGFYAGRSILSLGKEYKDLMVRGKTRIYSFYVNQNLIKKENLTLDLNLGFDYKDVFNFQLGQESSRDRLRVARAGLDLDVSDRFGRSIVSNELDFGIPNIMGGLRERDSSLQGTSASKGVGASRAGSGGKFSKATFNLLRLITMPFSSTLLLKSQTQISPYVLTSTEQFQLGGISNVRGYPSGEFVGDEGYTFTGEWTIPPYGISKRIKTFISKAKLYDALRFAAFYDWGNTRLRRTLAGEEKQKTLSSAGCGIRFNLPENFSARIDFAWPLDRMPSDENHLHTWLQVSKEF